MFSNGFFIDLQICIIALWIVYYFALHRRVSIKVSRTFLLMIIPLAAVISSTKIPVFNQIEYVSAPIECANTASTSVVSNYDEPRSATQIREATYAPTFETSTIVQRPEIPVEQIVWWIYLFGVAAMSIWTIIGLACIALFIRRSRSEVINAHRVIFTDSKISAYSFFGYIIVNEKYRNQSCLESIIRHENTHCQCRHTYDLLYMLILRTLLWFNPASWHLMKLLRQIHEYEVDRKVVAQGTSLANYMELLINADYEKRYIPVNQLSYSLTKKRLHMITHTFTKQSILRIVIVSPVSAMLICAFVLTSKAEIVEIKSDVKPTVERVIEQQIQQPEKTENQIETIVESIEEIKSDIETIIAESAVPITISEVEPIAVDAVASLTVSQPAILDVKTQPITDDKRLKLETTMYIDAEGDLPAIIITSDNKTLWDTFRRATRSKLDRKWITFIDPSSVESVKIITEARVKQFTLKDTKHRGNAIQIALKPNITQHFVESTLENYRAARINSNNYLNPVIILKTAQGKVVPLKHPNRNGYSSMLNDIKKEHIASTAQLNPIDAARAYGIVGVNGATVVQLKPFNGTLSEVLPIYRNLHNNLQPLSFEDRYDCYEVPSSQMVIANCAFRSCEYNNVLRVRHTKTETFVTVALPISWDSQWHGTDSNVALLDEVTGDRYHFRRLDGGLPHDRLLMIRGMKGKTLEITSVFPRLKDEVAFAKLIQTGPEKLTYPSNSTGFVGYRIDVKEKLKQSAGKDIF